MTNSNAKPLAKRQLGRPRVFPALIRVPFDVTPDQFRRLRKYMTTVPRNLPRSEVLRSALLEYLDRHEPAGESA